MLHKQKADAEIALTSCRQELSVLRLHHKHQQVQGRLLSFVWLQCMKNPQLTFTVHAVVALQEVAEQSSKQLHDILSTLQRGVADGLTVLSSARQGGAA